jgi:hypothetical protein
VSDNYSQPLLSGQPPEPTIYGTFSPNGDPFTIRIKSDNRDALSADFRRIVRELDPRLPWLSLRRAEDIYLSDAPSIRYIALTVGGLGLLALVLAVIGLYAVMSYVVLLRRQEISVRMAIGAKSKDIVVMMLTQAARLVLWQRDWLNPGVHPCACAARRLFRRVRVSANGVSASCRADRVRDPDRGVHSGVLCRTRQPDAGAERGLKHCATTTNEPRKRVKAN